MAVTAYGLTLYVTIVVCCLGKFSSADRTLSITVNSNLLELHVDGVFSLPPSDGNWATADNVTIGDLSRLIAVFGGIFTPSCPGLLASVTGDFLVTNGNWKCSVSLFTGWNTLGFDDSQWIDAYVIGQNGNFTSPAFCTGLQSIPSISANAYWIWTTSISDGPPYDTPIYCRGYLPVCEQQNPCLNGGTCHSNAVEICSCTPEYIGTYCETEKRSNLVVTSHDSLTEVYVDGVQSALPNRNDMNATDTVPIPTHGRLISVMSVSRTDACPGLIAYVTQSTIVSDAGWRCSPFATDGDWSQLGFDDSAWSPAVVLGKNGAGVPGCENLGFIQDIGPDANWIWTQYSTQDPKQSDKAVFCRVYLPACQTTTPCLNGGTCLDNDKNMCKCTPEWAGTYCEQANNPCFYDPCLNNGTCTIVANRYECVCPPGYVGLHCDRKVPERSLTITARQTLNSVYVDDVIKSLTFPGEWNTSDVVALSTEARLIAVMATDLTATCAGILASVTGDYLVSDVTWRCNRTIAGFPPNWFQLGYDDSAWTSAYVIGRNGDVTAPPACASIPLIPSISGNAFWIWTSSIASAPSYDETVYCRGYMPTCQYDNPCRNNATCNRNNPALCTCLSGFTGKYCESLVDRKWTITVKSTLLDLYVDGIKADNVPNADNVTAPDTVSIKPYARLIAASALDSTNTCPGILGSATGDYLLTGATWRCTAQEVAGWASIGFDDSLWQQAYPIGYNGGQMLFPECNVLPAVPSISPNAFWIWTNFSAAISGYDPIVYCRGYLPLCQVKNPCFNGGVCNANSPVVCSCLFGFSGTFCENEDTKTLSFTADKSLSAAYVDGVPLELSNPEIPSAIDSVTIRANARLLSIMAVKVGGDCPGIIASVYDGSDYFLTGSTWKCSAQAKFGWFQLGFDDSTWTSAYVIQANQDLSANPCPGLPVVSEISPNAYWIWTNSLPTHHVTVYCRGYLPTCQFTTCANGGTCNPNSPTLCTCVPGYTGLRCESVQ